MRAKSLNLMSLRQVKKRNRKETVKMSKTRIKVYAYLVFNGLRTIDEVPKRFRKEVEKEVEKMKQGIFFE